MIQEVPYIQTFVNFQRHEPVCQPLDASCCSVRLYFSVCCTVKIKNACFFLCLFFYVHIICVKSIINLLKYDTIQLIVLVGHLG